jgi:hypothetical protein
MKATKKRLIAGIGLLTVAGIILYLGRRYKTNIMNERRAQEVADHGYETAHDILFPKKQRRIKKYRYYQG